MTRDARNRGETAHLRVLADLLNRPARTDGVFLAPTEGRSYGTVLAVVDPLRLSHLTARFGSLGGEEVMLIRWTIGTAGSGT